MVSKDGSTKKKELQLKLKKVNKDDKDPTIAKNDINLAKYLTANDWIEDSIKLNVKRGI
jgi:hypothetical protein